MEPRARMGAVSQSKCMDRESPIFNRNTKIKHKMKSYEYDAVVHDCAIYCVQCVPAGVKVEDCHPIFADSEWDHYPMCDHCHAEHDYVGLTTDGQRWLEEQDNEFCQFERFELKLPKECVADCSHAGECDNDVAYWSDKLQCDIHIDANLIRDELKGYGAWDADELADDDANLRRIIWIGACIIREEKLGSK
jgi:hypothetical protein